MSRRISAAIAAFLLCCLAGIAPASADATVTVRATPTGPDLTNPFAMAWGCSGPPVDPLSIAFTATDANPAPTLGDASWGLQVQAGSGGNEFGPAVDVPSSASLATFSVKVFGVTAGQALVQVSPPDLSASPQDAWVGTSSFSVAAASSWQTASVPLSASYSWQLYDFSGPTPTPIGSPTSSTLAAFDTAHGASTDYVAGLVFGCPLGAGQTYYFDAFSWGASGQVTTYNYDKFTTSATAAAPATLITAGRTATINGQTSWSSSMMLQQRRYGSSVWQDLRAVTGGAPDAGGLRSFTAKVAPLTQTSYRWSIPGASCCLAGMSSPVTVKVYTAVTIKLADSTIRKGQNLVVSGVTKPHKAGVRVTLWRRTADAADRIATSTVHADGTYKISYRVPSKGTWKVYVTVAAASGNLPGTSAARTATVS